MTIASVITRGFIGGVYGLATRGYDLTVSVSTPDKRDTFETTPDQWKKYRERLLSLSQASEQFLQSKYIKESVQESIEEIHALDDEIKESALIDDNGLKTAQFYQAFKYDLSAAIEKLNKMIVKIEQDEEDDIHSILLLSGGL